MKFKQGDIIKSNISYFKKCKILNIDYKNETYNLLILEVRESLDENDKHLWDIGDIIGIHIIWEPDYELDDFYKLNKLIEGL
jgi:hypothetical protein